VQIEPSTVSSPVLDILVSNLLKIKIDWDALTGDETGGSPIDSYNLQWDNNSNGANWSDLKGELGSFDTAVTFTQEGLTGGRAYKFRLKAHNDHGWSVDYSTVVSYLAA